MSILQEKPTFFILHTHFYKIPTSICLFYHLFYLNNYFSHFFILFPTSPTTIPNSPKYLWHSLSLYFPPSSCFLFLFFFLFLLLLTSSASSSSSSHSHQNLRQKCKPLFDRLQTNPPPWTLDHTSVVQEIKKCVKTLPCLGIPSENSFKIV